jgi:hypothetical protein
MLAAATGTAQLACALLVDALDLSAVALLSAAGADPAVAGHILVTLFVPADDGS